MNNVLFLVLVTVFLVQAMMVENLGRTCLLSCLTPGLDQYGNIFSTYAREGFNILRIYDEGFVARK